MVRRAENCLVLSEPGFQHAVGMVIGITVSHFSSVSLGPDDILSIKNC